AVVRQHLVELAVGEARLMHRGHPLTQVVGKITDRGQFNVVRLFRRVEVGDLRNGSAAKDAEPQQARVFVHRLEGRNNSTGSGCPFRRSTTERSRISRQRTSTLLWPTRTRASSPLA